MLYGNLTWALEKADAPNETLALIMLACFLIAALKVTLGFFVWLFRAVFKWVM